MSIHLTLPEAADRLGTDLAGVRRLISTGRLDVQQVCSGRCELVVSLESVDALTG